MKLVIHDFLLLFFALAVKIFPRYSARTSAITSGTSDREGQVVPRGQKQSADYLFRQEKVVVELKTLLEDATPAHVRKLSALTNNWMNKGLVRGYGRLILNLQTICQECQHEGLDLLQGPVEGVIRKANSQIRSTKNAEQLADAKGLLLIVNDGNSLRTEPVNFMILVARILQKKSESGEQRFPEIRGVVYFSYRVPAARESTLFWVAGTMEPEADGDLRSFQARLQREWLAYYARIVGRPNRH